ncbi:MAG: reverse transcriptase-like protein [Patescibacteria group bacterium]|nr:reverse transcriptase-like protein [Patescibacteria group bacterium]
MKIVYTDGSYKDGSIGMAVVVLDRGTLVKRIGWASLGVDSAEAEIDALEKGLRVARESSISIIRSDAKWLDVYLRGVKKSRKYDLSDLINSYLAFCGEIDWIPRKLNKVADGLAKAALFHLPWQEEINIGDSLRVVKSLTPGHFIVDDHIVNKKNGRWYCSCDLAEPLSVLHLPCRHIRAVQIKVNEATQAGELVE